MKPTVLVVDDDEAVRRVIRRGLGERFELIEAPDGARALELAMLTIPDAVLLDLELPGVGGLEVLAQLRSRCGTKLVPVLMMTGRGAIEDRVAGLAAGADDYIVKPFALEELHARLEGRLRRTRQTLSANPLTKLPGAPMIQEDIERRIGSKLGLGFCWIDIDGFKGYNDRYGYARGDQALLALGRVLQSEAGRYPHACPGHIGGDDFAAACDAADAPELAARIARAFDDAAATLHDPQDLERGGFETFDRLGRAVRMPLLALSIGGVTSQRRELESYAQVVALAAEMKAYCKSRRLPGSRWAFDRRAAQ